MTQRHPELDSLYCINPDGSRNAIHPADVRGRFATRKKLVWTVLIAIYLVLPHVTIGGHPAVLLDIVDREFYLFGGTFNAQDVWLVFFLITGLGFSLFVVSALWGRIWCGYACPHSVFLEAVYRRIERWFEGGASARKRLAELPWRAEKIARRGGKWLTFAAVTLVLSHTFLSYFMGRDEVLQAVTSPPSAHPTAFTFVVVFTLIVYFNFAWFREQLCIVICPYGRLQGVLYDRDTVNVSYDAGRGEPRGKYTTSERGACIDCYRCVAVCPTGIDIRNGTQLECIGCANCIDACDEVMDKVGQERGLVRYASQNELEGTKPRLLRPRVAVYAVLLLIGATVFGVAASGRTSIELNFIRQRGAPYTLEEDGTVLQNAGSLHAISKLGEAATFALEPTLVPDGVEVVLPVRSFELEAFGERPIPVFLRVPRASYRAGTVLEFTLRTDGDRTRVRSVQFLGPPNPNS